MSNVQPRHGLAPIEEALPDGSEREGHMRWKTLFGRDRYWRLISLVLEGEWNWRRAGWEQRFADDLTLPARGSLAKVSEADLRLDREASMQTKVVPLADTASSTDAENGTQEQEDKDVSLSSSSSSPVSAASDEAVVKRSGREMPPLPAVLLRVRPNPNTGWRDPRALRDAPEADNDNYDLCFTITKTWSKERFLRMNSRQKVNFMPGHHVICIKTKLHTSIQGVRSRNTTDHADFAQAWWPRSYNIPQSYDEMMDYWRLRKEQGAAPGFILKPPNASKGAKIRLIHDISAMPAVDDPYILKETPLAQEYIDNPLTVCGYKCTLRVFVAVTGVDPMRIFVFRNALGRICHLKYSRDFASTLNNDNLEVHLTNCDIAKNRNGEDVLENFVLPSPEGDGLPFHMLKTDVRSLLDWFAEKTKDEKDPRRRCNPAETWRKIEDVCLQVSLLATGSFTNFVRRDVRFRWNCFELLGFDIMLDDHFQPWCLEVNHSPALEPDGWVANEVKTDMLRDLFTLTDVRLRTRTQFYEEYADLRKRVADLQASARASDCTLFDAEAVWSQFGSPQAYFDRQRLLYEALEQRAWLDVVLLLQDQDIMALFHAEFENRPKHAVGWIRLFPDRRVFDDDLDWLVQDGGRTVPSPLDRNMVAAKWQHVDAGTISQVIDRAQAILDQSTTASSHA